MNFINFIPEHLLILIAGTTVLGVFLKRSEMVKDKYIVTILMLFSIVLSVVLGLNSNVDIVNGILQGILCWGAAVGLNQTAKQLSKFE